MGSATRWGWRPRPCLRSPPSCRTRAGPSKRSRRRSRSAGWLLLAACAAGFLANPFGWRLLSTPLVATDAEAMSQIGEMGRLPLAAFATLGANLELRSAALVNLVVLAGLVLVPTWLGASAASALGSFALGLGLLLFRGRRMVPELALLALPAIAGALAIRLAQGRGRGLRRGLQALAVYLVVAAAVTTWRDARSGLFEPLSDRLPHGPVALLQRLASTDTFSRTSPRAASCPGCCRARGPSWTCGCRSRFRRRRSGSTRRPARR